MTSHPFLAYALERDFGLERTNPVHVVQTLLRRLTPDLVADPRRTVRDFSQLLGVLAGDGLRLPSFYLEELRRGGCLEGEPAAADPPRVVGLTVDLKRGGDGFALPLHLEPSEQPELDERLPFTHDDLYDVFAGLVRAVGLTNALPERLHFRGRNPMRAK